MPLAAGHFFAGPIVVTSSGGTGVDHHQTDNVTVTTNGQTAFTLSATPVDINDVEMTVNGIEYTNGVDFTITGTSVTWNNVLFTLRTGDMIIFDYDF